MRNFELLMKITERRKFIQYFKYFKQQHMKNLLNELTVLKNLQ